MKTNKILLVVLIIYLAMVNYYVSTTANTITLNSPTTTDKSLLARDIVSPTAVEVDTWAMFRAALGDPTISEIRVTADLTANSAGVTVTREVKVDFGGHNLNIGSFTSAIVNTGGSLTYGNLSFSGTATGRLFDGTGTAILSGTVSSGTGNLAAIALMNNSSGTLIIDSASLSYDRGSNTTGAIQSKNLTVTNSSQVNSTAIKFYSNNTASAANGKILIDGGSQVETISLSGNSSGQVWDIRRTMDIIIQEESSLTAHGNLATTGDSGGTMVIVAPSSTINVKQSSTLNIISERTSALLMQSSGGSFNVDSNSKINLTSNGDSNTLGSTLRFRLEGNMSFNVSDKSEININKTAGSASAIRLYGANNKINIMSGSDFNVRNEGNGSPQDPGSDGRNQGIQYDSAAGGGAEFNVVDEDSSVKVIAENGAAIDAQNYPISILADEGTYFVTRGTTRSSNRGIFNGGNLQFNLNSLKYYDFANMRSGGGQIFETTSTASFNSIDTQASFWRISSNNVNGDFDYSWDRFSYSFDSANFSRLTSSTKPDMASLVTNLNQFTRISGNNQTPILAACVLPLMQISLLG